MGKPPSPPRSGPAAGDREAGRPSRWWSRGLCFACQRSGNCCTGLPGSVRLATRDILLLAHRFGLDDREFRRRLTRSLPNGGRGLVDDGHGACILYSKSVGCLAYDLRPRQCRTWPFWGSVLATRERWAEEARSCPGMNQGPLHDADEIAETIDDDGTSGTMPD